MVGGQESARSILHLAEGVSPRRPGAPVPRSASSPPRACAVSSRSTGSPEACATSRPTTASGLSLNTATVRKQGDLLADPRSREAARHLRLSPWRDQVAGRRPRTRREALSRRRLPALRLLPRRHVSRPMRASRRRCATTTAAPSTRRRRSARRASCWSSAACRNSRGPARPPRTTSPPRARRSRRRSATLLDYAHAAGMPLAIEPLHPMYAADRACVNTLAQALDICDRLDPDGARALGVARRRLSRLVGSRCLSRRSRRAGRDAHPRLPRLRLAGADARPAARPRHDGRRRDRDPKTPRGGRGGGLCRPCEVEIFSDDWWSRPIDDVLSTCIARHKTAV